MSEQKWGAGATSCGISPLGLSPEVACEYIYRLRSIKIHNTATASTESWRLHMLNDNLINKLVASIQLDRAMRLTDYDTAVS
jgi:hypothetical protein